MIADAFAFSYVVTVEGLSKAIPTLPRRMSRIQISTELCPDLLHLLPVGLE